MPWWGWIVLLLAVPSAIALRGLGRRLQARRQPTARSNGGPVVGERVTAEEAIAPGSVGRVELRGSVWRARNAGRVALLPGRSAPVTRVDGRELVFAPEVPEAPGPPLRSVRQGPAG